ncbi:MAG TPA: Hsp33 family molecular chaperone HslO [Ruminiclostridium sp.]|nr:Hsp33 family molecular chaperone HslO [Ruminiclostridium sp.]
MTDYIAKAMALSGQVRIYSAVTTGVVEEARILHDMNPTPAVALGRVLTGAALMSQTLKGENQSITIQIKGDGPIGGIVAVTDSKAGVRGYVYNPFFDVPLNDKGKFDIAAAVGKGYLNVIKDIGMKEPYIGYVDLVSGEIAEDLTYYYAYSEQIPTVMNLGVLIGAGGKVEAAGGFFIQLLPDAREDSIEKVEKCISDLLPVTTLIHQGKTPEDLINLIFPDEDVEMFDTCPVRYQCNCSRDRMERNLMSLGVKNLSEIAEEEKSAELQCHFCNKKYQFTGGELLKLLDGVKSRG